MKTNLIASLLAVAALVAANVATPARAGVIVKANNADALNLGSSWVGGIAPGASDVATWSTALASGSRTTSLGADVAWNGMAISFDPGGNLAFNVGNTLTLGAAGIDFTPDRVVTLNNAVVLGTDQVWSTTQNVFTPAGTVNTAGYRLTLRSAGRKQFKGAIIGGGDLVVDGGTLQLSNGSVATPSAVTVNPGATLWFDTASGPATNGAARADRVTLNRAVFNVGGHNNTNSVDSIANALTFGAGYTVLTVTPNIARNERLTAGSLVRNPGSTVLLRGTALGTNTIASATTNSASITFGTAPTLVGSSGVVGSTTNSILVGFYGDKTVTGNGTALATYDATYGIRVLDTNTEFTASIASGQTQLDNVRYVNVTGSGVITNTLTANATINSLSFDQTGAGTNTSIILAGNDPARELTINSGVIFSRQIVAKATASDSTIITNVTLNLNGREGVILCASQNDYNQGNPPAPLYIYSAITNDGGNGVTVGAIGSHNSHVRFVGLLPHRYTGATVLNSGYLRLDKGLSNNNIGVPGDLIINGGNVLTNPESVPDGADLTLNGGAFTFDSTTSSGNGGRQETIRNLYMNGGTINYNSGTGHRFYIDGDAVVNAQDLRLNTGGDVTVLGTTTLNGGRVLVSLSSVTNDYNAWFTLNDVVITNTATSAYSPIVLKSHASNIGGQLILKGTLTFVGNASNTNAALFASDNLAAARQGLIALDGTRTFDIGDGAAAVDVHVHVAITNNGATVGALVKTGAGTLALNNTNFYTGGTAVNLGTLAGTGSLASDVDVAASAAISPGTPGTIGTLTVVTDVDFANGAVFKVDASGANADLLAVGGAVTGSGPVSVVPNVADEDGEWLVMTADSIAPSFISTDPKWSLAKRAGGTQLWLTKTGGTVVIVR